jgi:hypothetical protein
MAKDLPYLSTYKNVGVLFERILAAKAPDAFTTRYLTDTLGLKSTADRNLITLLRSLGFLDSSGKPTTDYMLLKNPATAGAAIAEGIKKGYGPLFAANENAHDADASALKGLIAQVTGANTDIVSKTHGTLQALLKKADFKSPRPNGVSSETTAARSTPPSAETNSDRKESIPEPTSHRSPSMRPEFHYNIQIHLPANATEETYLDIFNAMRKAFIA